MRRDPKTYYDGYNLEEGKPIVERAIAIKRHSGTKELIRRILLFTLNKIYFYFNMLVELVIFKLIIRSFEFNNKN